MSNSSCNWRPNASGYAVRIMLPSPDDSVCNVFTDKQMPFGYEYQFRIEVTGHCRIRIFRPSADTQSDKVEGECPLTQPECVAVEDCQADWFNFNSHGT